MAQSAQILTFPNRPTAPPMAAPPAIASPSTAPIVAHRECDRAELVSALLLAIEAEYLAPVLCYPIRDVAGRADVAVMVGRTPFRLRPDDCRLAAEALTAENAFAGCIGVAADLREAAALAETRGPRGGRIERADREHGHTGMASTLGLSALVLFTAVAALVERFV